MNRFGEQILRESKAAVLASDAADNAITKSSSGGRDLLSLLLRANMAEDLPESQRLSDRDTLSR